MPSRVLLIPRFMGALLALVGCSDGDLLTLGDQREPVQTVSEFVGVEKVAISSDARDENPTLTSDMLEIYFNSERDGGAHLHDIWWARRDSVEGEFGEPEALPEWRETGRDISPAISSDGLTLWVAYRVDSEEGDATTDIWSVTRSSRESTDWNELREFGDLNTLQDERPRPLGWYDRIMPMSRYNDMADPPVWETWLAEQNDDRSFDPPQRLEIDDPEVEVVDGFLTEDGLTFLFKRRVAADEEDGDLYWSKRRDVSEPFRGAELVPGPDINTDADERDPWLSADGTVLYFVSAREDEMNIYRATWEKRPVDDDESAP